MTRAWKWGATAAAVYFAPVPELGAVAAGLSWFASPMIGALAPLWQLTSEKELVFAALVSWWSYATLAKWAVMVPGRFLGLAAPSWSRTFARLSLPWRWPYRTLVLPVTFWYRQLQPLAAGTAQWASLPSVLARFGGFRPGRGIPFGRVLVGGIPGTELLGYESDKGVVVCGAPGSGKSNLFGVWLGSLTEGAGRDASAIVVDVDGELTRVFGDALVTAGHRVVCLDFLNGRGGRDVGVYNLVDELRDIEARHGRGAVIPAIKVAAGAIVTNRNQHQPVFDDGGRRVVAGTIGYVYKALPREEQSLATVRRLLTQGLPVRGPKEHPLDALAFEMTHAATTEDGTGSLLNELIRDAVAVIENGTNADGGNPFLNAAVAALDAWVLPAVVQATTGESHFTMADLKTGNTIVTLVVSPQELKGNYQSVVRLMLCMYEHRFASMPRGRTVPSVAIVDEAQNLGRLSLVEAGPHMRKHEVLIGIGIQDVPGLGAHGAYPDTWESILGSAGLFVAMATTEEQTLGYISKRLGMATIREKVEGTPWWAFWVPRTQRIRARYAERVVALKDPGQVAETLMPGRGRVIVFTGGRPLIATAAAYWNTLALWQYAPSTYGESLGRRIGRALLRAGQGGRDVAVPTLTAATRRSSVESRP